MKETAKELDITVGVWLAEHREKEYSGKDRQQDFMDVMLSVVQDAQLQGHYDADTIIKATCQVREELDKHIGRDRRVNELNINNLVYLQAIPKETLKLYPVVLLGGRREFTEDSNVGGYHVPKGYYFASSILHLLCGCPCHDPP
ncbi:hypothetical protein Pfo_008207 [Paulownia fortunei]|nr:hypothetical protein Pfo_008207 [Paulownia fortunei]